MGEGLYLMMAEKEQEPGGGGASTLTGYEPGGGGDVTLTGYVHSGSVDYLPDCCDKIPVRKPTQEVEAVYKSTGPTHYLH